MLGVQLFDALKIRSAMGLGGCCTELMACISLVEPQTTATSKEQSPACRCSRVEPSTTDIQRAGSSTDDERLVVASRLSTSLAQVHSTEDVASVAVRQLHDSFDYYLAVVQRLDPDGSLRVVGAEGPLAEAVSGFLALVQPVEVGVNGRVARSGEAVMVNDTNSTPTT